MPPWDLSAEPLVRISRKRLYKSRQVIRKTLEESGALVGGKKNSLRYRPQFALRCRLPRKASSLRRTQRSSRWPHTPQLAYPKNAAGSRCPLA